MHRRRFYRILAPFNVLKTIETQSDDGCESQKDQSQKDNSRSLQSGAFLGPQSLGIACTFQQGTGQIQKRKQHCCYNKCQQAVRKEPLKTTPQMRRHQPMAQTSRSE